MTRTTATTRQGGILVALACALALVLAGAGAAQARLGDLDPSFDGDGVATPAVSARTAALRAVVIEPDGAVVAAGSAVDVQTAQEELLVLRLTSSGGLDPAFGGSGAISFLPAGEDGELAALAREPGGDVLAAGATATGSIETNPLPSLTRVSPTGGLTTIPVQLPTAVSRAALTGVAVMGDGRIVLGGWATIGGQDQFLAVRLLPGGAPDPGFGANGAAFANFGAGVPARAAGLTVAADGAVTLTGVASPVGPAPLPTQAAVARFTAGGAPDPGLNGIGLLRITYPAPFDGSSRFGGAAAIPDRLLATGSLANGSRGVLQRLRPDGSFDDAHGTPGAPPGAAVWQTGPLTAGEAVAANPGGGAVIAGRTGTANVAALVTGWLTATGAPDPAAGGIRMHQIGLSVAGPPVGLALGAGERLAVAGTTPQQQPFVARFASNAAPAAVLSGPAQVVAGAPAAFDAGGSSDPEGEPLRFEFDLDGDGSYELDGGGNALAVRSFPAPGGYTVGVRVSDPRGASATATHAVTVVAPPRPVPQPVLGEQGVAQPLSGIVRIRLPGTRRFVRLTELAAIPNGTEIDARKGRVFIAVLRNASGRLDGAAFYKGRFIFSQGDGPRPITRLKLSGGSFENCTVRARGSSLAMIASVKGGTGTRKKRRVRRLWGDGRGRFRTRGRYGAATVRGTRWLTLDRCDGTKVRVAEGKVAVKDLGRPNRPAKIVRAGRSILVPHRR